MSKGIIYELSYLISGQLDENKSKEEAGKTEKILKEKGSVLNYIEPKKIRLAYPIKKQQEGYLVSFDFNAEPKNLTEISKEMEKQEAVLRFLIIKKSPQKPEESEKQSRLKKPEEEKEIAEESPKIVIEKPKKEKVKKEKPTEKENKEKEEDLKKIEKDLDEILGS